MNDTERNISRLSIAAARAEERAAAVRIERDAVIREAVQHGNITASAAARIAGLTRGRVHQILKGD